jgi:cytochrome bd ubiquinol oxidase subunit II
VGALRTIVGSTDTERRVAINATGPFWDGNEVWLIVGRHVRGVPAWYATIFSGLYLALVLVLLALMARGVHSSIAARAPTPGGSEPGRPPR